MMPRWPDGSMVADVANAAAAEQLGEQFGCTCWVGPFTGDIHALANGVLIIAKSPARMAARLTSATHSPASPPPRGQGAPDGPGGHRRALRM